MTVTAAGSKMDPGRYPDPVAEQDIPIAKNGKGISRVTDPDINRAGILDSLAGAIPDTALDEDHIREERLGRQ